MAYWLIKSSRVFKRLPCEFVVEVSYQLTFFLLLNGNYTLMTPKGKQVLLSILQLYNFANELHLNSRCREVIRLPD